MDEPTVAEIIRDIQADVKSLVQGQEKFVRKDLYERERADHERRIVAMEERRKEILRLAWSAILGPVIVGVVLYLLLGSKT